MKENSIKEDIKIIENILHKGYTMSILHPSTNIKESEIKALEHILSDYKRILEINEILLKENEILKKEKEQAWEEWNNLEQGSYETEQKLKQQIKKIQKENEELKIKKQCNKKRK